MPEAQFFVGGPLLAVAGYLLLSLGHRWWHCCEDLLYALCVVSHHIQRVCKLATDS